MAKSTTEKPFYNSSIPINWEIKKLGDIGKIKMCRRIFNHETTENGDIPFYKIGTFGKEADAFISKEIYDSYRKRFSFPKEGDILISAAGTIGRTVVYDGNPAYFQDSNIVWISNDESEILNEYLNFVYQNIKYETEGGTIQRLYNNIISNTKFLCPPIPEQKAIAHILSLMDTAINKNNLLIAKKELQKKWLMQNLLTGKKRLKGFEGEWKEVRIEDVLFNYQNGYAFSATGYIEEGIPIITMAQIGLDGTFQYDANKVNYWKEDEAGKLKDFLLKKGDLIIAMTDVTPEKNLIGRMAIINIDGEFLLNQRVGLLRIDKNKVNSTVLAAMSSMKDWRDYSRAHATLGVQANLGTADIKNAVIKLAPIEEQTAIAQVLQAADKEIQLLKTKTEKLREQKKGMMQVLLTGKKRLILNNRESKE